MLEPARAPVPARPAGARGSSSSRYQPTPSRRFGGRGPGGVRAALALVDAAAGACSRGARARPRRRRRSASEPAQAGRVVLRRAVRVVGDERGGVDAAGHALDRLAADSQLAPAGVAVVDPAGHVADADLRASRPARSLAEQRAHSPSLEAAVRPAVEVRARGAPGIVEARNRPSPPARASRAAPGMPRGQQVLEQPAAGGRGVDELDGVGGERRDDAVADLAREATSGASPIVAQLRGQTRFRFSSRPRHGRPGLPLARVARAAPAQRRGLDRGRSPAAMPVSSASGEPGGGAGATTSIGSRSRRAASAATSAAVTRRGLARDDGAADPVAELGSVARVAPHLRVPAEQARQGQPAERRALARGQRPVLAAPDRRRRAAARPRRR